MASYNKKVRIGATLHLAGKKLGYDTYIFTPSCTITWSAISTVRSEGLNIYDSPQIRLGMRLVSYSSSTTSLFLFPFSFPSSAHPPLLLGRGGLSWGVVRGWVVTGEGVSCSTAQGHLTTESRVTMTSIISCMEVTPPVSNRQGMELCVVNHEMPNIIIVCVNSTTALSLMPGPQARDLTALF